MMVIVIKNIQLPNGYYKWKYCDTYLCHKLDTTSQSVVRNTNSISKMGALSHERPKSNSDYKMNIR